jgi:hypothetical protein
MSPRDRNPDEEQNGGACADCGAPMEGSERSYAFGEQSVLCWACAVRRGGRHDAQEDTWITAPAVDDLLRSE